MKYFLLLFFTCLTTYEFGRFSAFIFGKYICSGSYSKKTLNLIYWSRTIIEVMFVISFALFTFKLFGEL